jgi:hypothetical protein
VSHACPIGTHAGGGEPSAVVVVVASLDAVDSVEEDVDSDPLAVDVVVDEALLDAPPHADSIETTHASFQNERFMPASVHTPASFRLT